MDDLKLQTHETPEPLAPSAQSTPKSLTARYGVLALAVLLIIGMISIAIARHDDRHPTDAAAAKPAPAPSDVIETTPDQWRQIKVEPVREQMIDLDLETTGKVGFNEDRLTPVFAPYGGRALEVLANKGDRVQAGQPLLVIESPDLVTAVNDLA